MRRAASSPNHFRPPVDYILSLRDRQIRDRDGVYFVEGLRFAHAALSNGSPILGVAWCPELGRPFAMGQLRDALASYPQQTLTKAQMQELGFSPEPQGVALVLRQTPQILPESGTLRPGTWVGVESIRTPGNLGTILRSMVATGSPGVFLFGNQGRYQDIYEPGVIRASMGAHLRLKVVKTTYREFARWTYRSEFRVLGADAKGSLEYRSVNYRRLLLFMIGDERSGLSPGQRSACDDLVRIPMAAEIDSLNVAMAATVLLFESFGQRRAVRRGR